MLVFFRLVENRIYSFGGCYLTCGTGQNWILYSNDLLIGNSNESNYSSCEADIETFRKITTESMPTSDEQYQVV